MKLQKTALITGATGFTAHHQAEILVNHGYRVYGMSRKPQPMTSPFSSFFACDLRDSHALARTIALVKPDFVFHFAVADPSVPLEEQFEVNVIGTRNLLETIKAESNQSVIVIPGSAAEYGWIEPTMNPIPETQMLQPISDYGLSKVAQSLLGYRYYRTLGLRILRTRTFNLTGPGEPERLVCSAFARQIAEIEIGRREPILYVGNLSAKRDFVDVRDAAEAYALLAKKGEAGQVYNVCSSRPISVSTILEILLGYSSEHIEVRVAPERVRRTDVPEVYGDSTKLRQLGWVPQISLEKSLYDLLAFWRKRLQSGGS